MCDGFEAGRDETDGTCGGVRHQGHNYVALGVTPQHATPQPTSSPSPSPNPKPQRWGASITQAGHKPPATSNSGDARDGTTIQQLEARQECEGGQHLESRSGRRWIGLRGGNMPFVPKAESQATPHKNATAVCTIDLWR